MKPLTAILIYSLISVYSFSQDNLLMSYKSYFDDDLNKWAQSFNNFRLDRFRISDTIKFESIPFEDMKNLKEFYEIYKPALSFSKDSTKFIDIYSYWLNLEKQGKKIVSNADIDQAVSLCDLKNNKWTRVFFCGYSTRIDEVLWISNEDFILVGTLLDEKNAFHPKILIGDIIKKVFFAYVDYSSSAKGAGYVSPKFRKLNIQ